MTEGFDPVHVRCVWCGSGDWSIARGSGAGLKVSGIVVGQYDMLGKATIEDGIEYAAFTCNGCGYVRLHDPAFVPPDVLESQ